ncbi:MAG: retroviral-like aspartic protease family protein [Tolypothrix brevis GSE-NOS-MK-07-07A]|jgi:predicted aspartyl protease|nr:retroviral-like aspartic protease family protein [Tolypothrix brevis GSE-NOS-MK-07-07A]
MLHYLSRGLLIFLSGTLAVLSFGCREDKQNTAIGSSEQPAQMNNLAAEPDIRETAPATSPETESQTPVKIEPTSFELGLDKAIGGLTISQSAQSRADWRLVASQYEDAIALMKQVQQESPDFAIARRKITEYQIQAKYAQEKATVNPLLTTSPEPQKIVVAVPEASPSPKFILQPLRVQVKKLPSAVSSVPQTLNQAKEKERQEVFSVPIKRRIGGTPIIEVTFNGNQQFEMIVDTGASGTVITQQMASSLGVVSVGKAKANTASSKAVEFSIGYVDTIEAGGVSVNKVAVAIAGSDLETGLLGHDFFGNYDLTIKRDVVEFRPHADLQPNSSETQLTVPTSPKPRRIVEYP